ncbi:MAG: ABC transporter substrate-binding protein [Pyramidobacter sp.]|uniref:ABC transporter substrate-binding protein n=1 Tax=Pyramidobacter sp. TaxID=1943581 RepID=UPI002A7F77D0|nr:ABC transporter substrate-binding protein [Pyramidobacter sp.]MDY4032055.1 ABC transporter substrate-binding protein [Pyramidobacter sp.]
MKKLFAMVLCVASLLGLCAASAPAAFKDTITMVNELEPDTLDPRRGNGISNNIVMTLIYDSLVDLDREGKEIPRLATSWEFIDGTHLRMHLRRDVVFSNGYPLTAEDVLFSLARTKDDSTSYSTMIWYDEKNSRAEDPYTVVLAMHQPYAPVFNVLASGRCWIGCKKAMEEMGEKDYARAPVGSGAYRLVKWTNGASMLFERNEKYWGTPAKTKNVLLKFVPEPASRVIELETGAADFAFYINGSDIDRVNAIDGCHVESGRSEKYYLITMAMNHPILSNQKVRHALSYAVDIPALADAAFDGHAHAMTGVYPSIVEGWKDMGGWEYNPEKAKQLLAEAGYPNGFDIELHLLPEALYQQMGEIVQAYWAAVGVNARIEQSALATREAQGPWEASIRTATANEISNILIIYEKEFGSRLAPNDMELDGMLKKLKTLYNREERKVLLGEIQDYLYEKRYSIPFAEADTIFGVSDKIKNFVMPTTIFRVNVKDWEVEE